MPDPSSCAHTADITDSLLHFISDLPGLLPGAEAKFWSGDGVRSPYTPCVAPTSHTLCSSQGPKRSAHHLPITSLSPLPPALPLAYSALAPSCALQAPCLFLAQDTVWPPSLCVGSRDLLLGPAHPESPLSSLMPSSLGMPAVLIGTWLAYEACCLFCGLPPHY